VRAGRPEIPPPGDDLSWDDPKPPDEPAEREGGRRRHP
jgi:hypothetical protein